MRCRGRRAFRRHQKNRPLSHKTYMAGGADFESEGREFESLRARHEINGLSPAIYAAQRRSAALRSTDGSAPRTATTTAQQGTTDAQTPTAIG